MAFSHKETNWSATLNQAKYQVTEIDNQATYQEYPIQNEVIEKLGFSNCSEKVKLRYELK